MSASQVCRLLFDPPCSGAWNMAVDEALLEWSAEEGCCCWRFYGWREPTLSLGYFQPYGQRWQHAASRDCPAVRRLTGGGAILHDRELTYSLVLPSRHPLAARRDAMYQQVHGTLAQSLADFGVKATLCPGGSDRAETQREFLCFLRRAAGDVLVGGTKIAGSAQRRRRGAVLQHGSVLLHTSEASPELAALNDLAPRRITAEELAAAWLPRLAAGLTLRWRNGPLGLLQQRRAAKLLQQRYSTQGWVQRRRA